MRRLALRAASDRQGQRPLYFKGGSGLVLSADMT